MGVKTLSKAYNKYVKQCKLKNVKPIELAKEMKWELWK